MQTSTLFSDIYEIFAFVRHIAPNATKLSNSRYNEQMFFICYAFFVCTIYGDAKPVPRAILG